MAAILSVIIGVVQLLIGSRFALLLLGINPSIPIVDWVYDVSAFLISPFTQFINQSAVITQGISVESIFEPASLLALIVYGIVGSLLVRFIGHTTYHRPHQI